jgi:uncharacterized membrane protein YfcA
MSAFAFIDVAGQAVFWPGLALLGLGVGVIAGMFGVGGGFLMTPALTIVFGLPIPIAVGTALSQKIGTSVASFAKHREHGGGEPRIDAYMFGGGLMGAHAGATLLGVIERSGAIGIGGRSIAVAPLILHIGYLTMIVSAVIPTLRSLRKATTDDRDVVTAGPLARVPIPPYVDLPNVGLSRVSLPVLAAIGFVMGTISGLLGVGGGVALLPVLIYGYGLSIRHAAGTGILVLFGTVCAGTITHAWQGHVNLTCALAILLGSAVGSVVGAQATHRISPRMLRVAFALLLSATALALVADLARKWLH